MAESEKIYSELERYKENGIFSNSELTPKLMNKYCKLDENGKKTKVRVNKKTGAEVDSKKKK